MADRDTQPKPESPEIIAFASRMYDAARSGNQAVFEQALPAGLPANMTNDKGDSLLMLSTYHGHFALSRFLISYGADVNRLNDREQSPLAGAVFKHENEIVDLLLQAGADVDLGHPSAWEAAEIFKQMEEYGGRFRQARERLKTQMKIKHEGVNGVGGMKGVTRMA